MLLTPASDGGGDFVCSLPRKTDPLSSGKRNGILGNSIKDLILLERRTLVLKIPIPVSTQRFVRVSLQTPSHLKP